MRLLFVKHSLAWPRSSGHDVHTYYMMKACAQLGHEIALATVTNPAPEAFAGLPLTARFQLDAKPAAPVAPIQATSMQRRFRSFWGVSEQRILALRAASGGMHADAVIISGLDALPYFPGIRGPVRIWYAADEWVLHHLSQLQMRMAVLREHLRDAAIKGLYERAHRGVMDRVWVVTDADRRAMRWVAGVKNVDVLPNGVDADFFTPGVEAPEARTAVFWGRLDFGPNIQALEWFCRRVWPVIRRATPDARFTIVGFQPTDAVRRLASADGISLQPNVHDLRSLVRRHAVAVLPFVSGAGIKNKLLEAAAMGLPIVCTPMTARGLRGQPPLVTASSAEAFSVALRGLWDAPARRAEASAAVRGWVVEHHSWLSTARDAMAPLQALISARSGQP